jgi:hypothetical protein
MTSGDRSIPTGNPFSSGHVRPGEIDYLFPAGQSAATLVDRLRGQGWWGQIVGRRGTGKSTLLAALGPEIRRAGREPSLVAYHDGRMRSGDWAQAFRLGFSGVLVVDGFEQVALARRAWLALRCRVAGCGLLVTAHAPIGLPDLFQTSVDLEIARKVVDYLTREHRTTVAPETIAALLASRGGDLRETLFDLYDHHESARDGVRPAMPHPLCQARHLQIVSKNICENNSLTSLSEIRMLT